MPGWGLSQKLSRAMVISRTKELSLAGNFISSDQAERWRLVNRSVRAEGFLSAARQIADDMLLVVSAMLFDYLKLIDDGFAVAFGDGLSLEQERAAANSGVSTEEIEARRVTVQARGRGQQGPGVWFQDVVAWFCDKDVRF